MKVYSYSQARQRLAEVLDTAKSEQVLIRRRNGDMFTVVFRRTGKSPLDVPGIRTDATTQDILDAVCESRSRSRT